jgi:hypothetical protein
MADKKISQLTAATTPLGGTEVVPVVQSGTTKNVSVADLTAGRAVSATSLSVAAGAVATPAINNAANSDTGIYFPTSTSVGAAIDGLQRWHLRGSAVEYRGGFQKTVFFDHDEYGDFTPGNQLRITVSLAGNRRGRTFILTYHGDWTPSNTPSRHASLAVIGSAFYNSAGALDNVRLQELMPRSTFAYSDIEVVASATTNAFDIIIRKPAADIHNVWGIRLELIGGVNDTVTAVEEVATAYGGTMNTDAWLSSRGTGLLRLRNNDTDVLTAAAGGDVTIPAGNLVIGTAGKGIDFSATGQATGMTSELLADYEEGTWTPAFTSTDATFTYSFQQGYYTKIGRQVFVHAFIRALSAGTLSNAIFITGLPFTQSSATSAYGTVTFGNINRVDYPVGALAITGFIQGGETQIRLITAIDDTNAGSLTAEAFDGTTTAGFILSASYFTA